jgi:hypothetical protein
VEGAPLAARLEQLDLPDEGDVHAVGRDLFDRGTRSTGEEFVVARRARDRRGGDADVIEHERDHRGNGSEVEGNGKAKERAVWPERLAAH